MNRPPKKDVLSNEAEDMLYLYRYRKSAERWNRFLFSLAHRKLHLCCFSNINTLRVFLDRQQDRFPLECIRFSSKVTLPRHAMVNRWGSTLVSSRHFIAQAAYAKNGDTMDADFCGNWFPREESIDNRGSQRLQGSSLFSRSYDRNTVNSETWRTTEAGLRIPRPDHLSYGRW
jgi:hypothetical protein